MLIAWIDFNMRKSILTYFIFLSWISHLQASQLNHEDQLLRKVLTAYRVEPMTTRPLFMGPKEKLGQMLFFDPVMGGQTTRLARLVTSVAKAVLTGCLWLWVSAQAEWESKGFNLQKLLSYPEMCSRFLIVEKAILPLYFGMDEYRWVKMGILNRLWVINCQRDSENLLAVAASFPQVEPDEMLGRSVRRGGENQATYHADLVDMTVDPDNFQERTLNVYSNLVKRLLGTSAASTPMQSEYRKLFQSAYPATSEFDITHIGNALAAYISLAFQLKPAAG